MTSTYSNQHLLPCLPLPTLDETLDKFLTVVQAISDPKEAKEAVEKFRKHEGPELQTLLEEYAKDHLSYVEEFWSDAYLVPDDRVVLNLNPFFLFEDSPDAKIASSQTKRAASLVFASLKFASMLKNETLPPDTFRGTPLCMDQFKALFGSCRIPMENSRDIVENYPESAHVVVLQRCQIYYFQALLSDGSLAVNESEIESILTAIDTSSASRNQVETSKSALGALTTQRRSEWSLARKKIMDTSLKNKHSLDIIDQALFILVLDDHSPLNINESASNMLHGSYRLCETDIDSGNESVQVGTCVNRWYDKLQLIVCKDGSAGVNFEHSSIDGHTALRFASDIFAETIVAFAQSITKAIYGKPDKVPSLLTAPINPRDGQNFNSDPKRIEFDLSPDILDDIRHAEAAIGDELCSLDTHILEFMDYGKNFIVSKSMSPDSFVQVSILLAYYRLYGQVVCSYEPVLTKKFLHGRTEAMRSSTMKVKSLCKIFFSHYATKEDKLDALRSAVKDHSCTVKESAAGKGVDRHLYSLKSVAMKTGRPIPSFFKSEAWTKLNHTVISTSNCGNPALKLFGFGPVVSDGFGIGYIIKDTSLSYAITSKQRQTKRFAQTLMQTLQVLHDLLGGIEKMSVINHTISEPPVRKTYYSENSCYLDGFDDSYGESAASNQVVSSKQTDTGDVSAPLANVTSKKTLNLFDNVTTFFTRSRDKN